MFTTLERRITADEYFDSPAYAEHDFMQLIDGEMVIAMPPLPVHQLIVANILVMLWTYAKQHGGKAFVSPVEVRLDDGNVFEPDVLYLAPDTQCVVDSKRLIGAPDLVAEALSPSTAKYDRAAKFRAYQAAGVREYWIVDPSNVCLEIYIQDGGRFVQYGIYEPRDMFTSPTLGGQTSPVADVFAGA